NPSQGSGFSQTCLLTKAFHFCFLCSGLSPYLKCPSSTKLKHIHPLIPASSVNALYYQIPGLDLQNCSLKDPGPNFPQAHTAVIIDLQANPLEDDLANIFRGFTQLQTLILPQDVSCPGGINAWNTVTFYMNNQTCQGQRNLCNSTGDQEMCPENGSCVPDGPGLLQCVCADGFHGYKCMRQGSFSLLMFFGILGSTTLSVSILLWGTQRRKAKAS
uniref:EGF-like domain-containing protein n=1 Tax=Felis catus TaxID=9685 RepID=A0ABI7X974_FELCA